MLVHYFLERSAQRTPDAVAAIDVSGTATYAHLESRANRFACVLRDRGVTRGDRVVLAVENSIEWIAWYFAILKAGAIAVPLPHGARSDRLDTALVDCTPRACVTDGTTASAAHEALTASGVRVLVHGTAPSIAEAGWEAIETAVAQASGEAVDVPSIDLDLAAIIYTSGSTGRPRGVMLSHLNIRSNTESIVSYLRLQQTDRVLVVLPLHYVYGLSLLHTHVFAGASVIIENRSAYPNAALKTMQAHGATGFAGVPSTFALLLHRSAVATMQFPALRYVTQAGGPMSPAAIRQWRAAVPGVPFFVMYGATEASARLSYLDPADLDARMGSIGRAIPNVELRLLDAQNRDVASGDVGEIVARGANISSGYWNAPDETRRAFGPEGYHTGDLARRDEDGFFYIVGRTRDMLKVGAHRVGAKEIEEVLHEHPQVFEAAVVGAPHELLGETPVAFVAPRDAAALDAQELTTFCRTRLADYKVPSRIVTMHELPKSEAGKIDKQTLRARLDAVIAVGDPGR